MPALRVQIPQVLKEAVDQNRRVKNVIKASKTLLDEIQTSEQILLNPDKRDAMQVIRRKMNERSHLLHPSVTTLTQKDYSVHSGIEDENPAICHTSRGTGRLVILPPSIKTMVRDLEQMEARAMNGKASDKQALNKLGNMLRQLKTLFLRLVLHAFQITDWQAPLPPEKFVYILVRLGIRTPLAQKAFASLDTDNDGYLTVEEFLQGLCGDTEAVQMDPMLVQVQYAFFLKAFEVMGAAKNHDLTKDQFGQVMESHGCPTAEAEEIFSVLDIDGSGTLSLVEFARGLTLKV